MLRDFNISVDNRIHIGTDSTAAKGIACRRGLGKIRHLDVSKLWIQDKVLTGEMIVRKVRGESNISDGLTKYLDNSKLLFHLSSTGQVIMQGRHSLMPCITSDQ